MVGLSFEPFRGSAGPIFLFLPKRFYQLLRLRIIRVTRWVGRASRV